MRKLFDEFFYIPKHGKVREKVVLSRLVSMVVVVVGCLAAMGITAYAYFSHNIISEANIIRSANFEASVAIAKKDAPSEVVSIEKSGDVQVAQLQAGTYIVELSAGNSTANKGFCILTIGDKTYYTDQLGVDSIKKLTAATVKFELTVSAPTKLEISSHWGTSVYYGYQDAERMEIFIENESVWDLTEKIEESGTSEEGSNPSEPPQETPPAEEQAPIEPTEPVEESEPAEPTEGDESTEDPEPTEPEGAEVPETEE